MPIPWKALAPFAIVALILGFLVGHSLVCERPSIQAVPTAIVIVPTVLPAPTAPTPQPTPTDAIIVCVPLPQGGADCTGTKP